MTIDALLDLPELSEILALHIVPSVETLTEDFESSTILKTLDDDTILLTSGMYASYLFYPSPVAIHDLDLITTGVLLIPFADIPFYDTLSFLICAQGGVQHRSAQRFQVQT